MMNAVQVVTAIDSREAAGALARALVERRLAACVQVIGPISSTYRWQGDLQTEEEWLCLIKSDERLYSALEDAIRSIHSYEVPEILAMPVVAGSRDYLAWLGENVAGSDTGASGSGRRSPA